MRRLTLAVATCLIVAAPSWSDPKTLVDRAGDPLPSGAKARLGTLRFRSFESPYFITVPTADGKHIIRAGNTDTVQILDAITGQEVRKVKLENFTQALSNAVVSDDGAMLVGYDNSNGSLQFFSLETGKSLLTIAEVKDIRPDSLQMSGNGSAVSLTTPDNPPAKPSIQVWETKTGKKLSRLEPLHNSGVQVAFSQNGKRLASWGYSQPQGADTPEHQEIRGTVQVWDAETGKALHRIATDYQYVSKAAISPDGKRLLISNGNATIGIYSMETGKLERQLATRQGAGWTLAFAPDSKSFAAGGSLGFVQVWETETGKRLQSCEGPGCPLTKIVFDAKGKLRAFGTDCQTTRTWEVNSDKAPEPLTGHTGPANGLFFLPGGKQIATTGHDARIFIWDAKTSELVKQIDRPAEGFIRGTYMTPNPCEFSADGKYLVGCTPQGVHAVYELATGKIAFDLSMANLGHVRPAISANNMLAVPFQKVSPTASELRVGVWSLERGEVVRELKLPWQDVAGIVISPDGGTVACLRSAYDPALQPAAYVVEVMAWNVTTGKEKFQFKMPAAPLTGASFSRDGRALVIAVQNSFIWITDTETGEGRKQISVDNEFTIFGAPVFSPDGRTFAIARVRNRPIGVESKIQIWETASRSIRQELTGHLAYINSLTFAPDGLTLGSTANDTTALLWDLSGVDGGETLPAKLPEKELTELWDKLNDRSGDVANRALVRLAAAPADCVAFMRERLQPVGGDGAPTREQIAKWVKELDDDSFEVREKATTKLAEAGKAAEPDLTKALQANPSAEASQRIKQILDKLGEKDDALPILRPLRSLEILERIGTPEAKEIVTKLAGGKADSPLTIAAKDTLKRWR